jgi:hypothetical protein
MALIWRQLYSVLVAGLAWLIPLLLMSGFTTYISVKTTLHLVPCFEFQRRRLLVLITGVFRGGTLVSSPSGEFRSQSGSDAQENLITLCRHMPGTSPSRRGEKEIIGSR